MAKGKDMLLHRCASFVAKSLSEVPSVTDFPAEERSDETPQELATRRLSASSAESVRLVRKIPCKYETMNYYSFVYKRGLMLFISLFLRELYEQKEHKTL